ncbi:helix-turn-helix domain-containing protein [Tritonibacter mobilis]|uniref:helix-turn-helix domain-containing protein n=1 Tax=Tritonibacter mobilis TaxID=379347 RepID=UPI000806DDE8|nr:helix-turn-helix transcriptional regulator [Tritonibacter mobilis]GLP88223.1 transcriptional regulator [Tritonibacter mobilis]SDX99862.1 Helix-turn-helix domain-containing protein [Tritonibacter mobilis]
MAKTIRSKGQVALCQALVDARKSAGLGQDDLADRLKCHQSLVARLESGERRIDVVELVVLARAIGFDPFDVLAIVEAATESDHRI